MKVSFITTVFNEEKSIIPFLRSIFAQTKFPDEIIIVDGGSTDGTVSKISEFKFPVSSKAKIRLIFKKGNRSVGRNEAIKNANNEIVACSDAGCVLDKNWVKNIVKPFENPKVDVVSGYYKGEAQNIFQKCLIPYVLVMPDKVNPSNFLPATRSMAFRKSIWKGIGGFPEEFSNNEDYVFAKKLNEKGAKMLFKKNAVVSWAPRKNLKESFIMFFRFALGDIQANILRDKVILIFARYILGLYLLILSLIERSGYLFGVLAGTMVLYLIWSIKKNYKYVNNYKAFFFLPLIQVVSDLAVISGTILGIIQKISLIGFLKNINNNKGVVFIIIIYIVSVLSVISYGIPGLNHPFAYQMDEWHQSQSVRNLFKFGTPNMPGSANGSIFQFFLTGLYLIPFILLKAVDVFAIKSSVTNLNLQHNLFVILRFNTLVFGVMSIIILAKLVNKFFKANSILTILFFTVTPLWLSLSNYFKYDIALTFWIISSLFFLLQYGKAPTLRNYIISGIFCSLAIATKVSAVPLFLIYIFSFFYFNFGKRKSYKHLLVGLLVFLSTFIVFGIPDLILQKGDYREYLYSNIIRAPMGLNNFVLEYKSWWMQIILKVIPLDFGYVFSGIILSALTYWGLKLLPKIMKLNFNNFKGEIFLFISMIIFILSLIPLELGATGNRLLVLLPFFAILSSLFILKILSYFSSLKIQIYIIFTLLFIIQSFQSFAIVYVKWQADTRQLSSEWIVKNIHKGTTLGIENIPIYQGLPDLIVKEYCLKEANNRFKYRIIDSNSVLLPNMIIVTNQEVDLNYFKKSPKRDLLTRLSMEKYKIVKNFKPSDILYMVTGNNVSFFVSDIFPISTISIYERDGNNLN